MIEELQKEISLLEKKKERLNKNYNKRYNIIKNDIESKKSKLQEICPHKFYIPKYTYIPGGYYDRSQSITEKFCSVCNKLLDTITKEGYYE